MSKKHFLPLFVLVALLVMISVVPAVISQDATQISILQWSHFVPRYDEWFDEYAAEWGAANDVEVVVDHVAFGDIPGAITAEIAAGEGHSLIEWLFAPSAWIEGLHDLTDVNEAAIELFGEQSPTCKAASYLPVLDQYYGYCHGYVPDPGDYVISMWAEVGYPDGPSTYDELLEGGRLVYEQFGVPLGIGLSPELDSEMANRAVIWSFGGSVQDENENVVLNSPETIAAVEYMAELYSQTMTDEVFGWTAASNNQGLIAGELSYILNSISAYRSLQKIDEEAAADIGFTEALSGPRGQFASSHVWQIYIIPSHVEGAELEAAKQFLLDHTENYSDAVFNSELYNFPAFASTVPELEGWLADDPFGSIPADKLQVLATSSEWGVHLGYPGSANPAIGQVFGERLISNMVARVALGEMSAEESVQQAHDRAVEIFAEWRAKGMVGGDDM